MAGRHSFVFDAFDPLDPGFLRDPAPMVAHAHRHCPIFFQPSLNLWVLTKYQDIAAALADFRTFSSRAIGRVPVPADLAPLVPDYASDDMIIALDPPDHNAARMAMQRGFSRHLVEPMEPAARRIANQLIDAIMPRGHCNFIDEFGYPFSLGVIMAMLGLPTEHAADYRRWGEALIGLLVPKAIDGDADAAQTPLSNEAVRAHWEELAKANAFFIAIMEERVAAPGPDLISAMLQAKASDGGPAISRGAVARHLLSLVTAGHDTTANLIAHMVLLFSDNPDQLALVRNDPSLLPNAVEEGLRRRGSASSIFRIATRDVEVRGATIPRGALICLLLPGANLDAEIFPDPERFDVRRPNAARHLGLGHGRHACIGQPLVKIEGVVALDELYRRLPDLRIDRAEPIDYFPNFQVSALKSITARW